MTIIVDNTGTRWVETPERPVAGQMVAIRRLDPRTGEPTLGKYAHTLRGLASQGFHYADVDFPALVRATNEAVRQGSGDRHRNGKCHPAPPENTERHFLKARRK
jgi:hypothetical protein